MAALPARDTPATLATLERDFPQFVAARSVLETSLNHMKAMLHVPTMLMNAGWIESTKGEFEFYRHGVSPAVARVMEDLDRERMAVSDALGAGAAPLRRWIKETYTVEAATLWETIQTLNANVYKTSKARGALTSRYLAEDVPSGLVPIAALGEAAGVATPLMRMLIDLASRVHGLDHEVRARDGRRDVRRRECDLPTSLDLSGHLDRTGPRDGLHDRRVPVVNANLVAAAREVPSNRRAAVPRADHRDDAPTRRPVAALSVPASAGRRKPPGS